MHTREHLQGKDFRWHGAAASLEELLPAHDAGSRVVFVAPQPATALADLAGLILALAHAFYDRAQAHSPGFYDYPSHFVVGGHQGAEPRLLHTAASEPWSEAWCEVDVWPNTHHAVADPTPFHLIQAVYMLEPNILVWPADLTLPAHFAPTENAVNPDQRDMEGLLGRRLQQVLLYSHEPRTADDSASTRIELASGAQELARKALACLPAPDRPSAAQLAAAWYRPESVQAFLHPQPSAA